MSARSPFGALSPEQFLRDYWQKKPLLIKGAFSTALAAITPEELAGLAMEEDVESRLVQHDPVSKQWQLQHGPFKASTFKKLPKENYTLLVQAVDHWVPEVAALRQAYHCFPQWRFDDVMVSYAVKGGGVGPHIDQYDVFLIQGLGRRRWLVAESSITVIPNPEVSALRQIQPFEPSMDVIVEPGDVLYVPPGAPHCGTALEPCLTYSVGFRAPSQADIVTRLAEWLVENGIDGKRYTDPDLQAVSDAALIPGQTLQKVRALMQDLLQQPALVERAFACLVSQTRLPLEPPEQEISVAKLKTALGKNKLLERNDDARLAWFAGADGHVHLFANGEELDVGALNSNSAAFLCNQQQIDGSALNEFVSDLAFLPALAMLVNRGVFSL
ncbi:cupin domain-containing protein [Permianibacter sp. IMCC34836]|uniref:cupin domain-containing protein n=1 Tax=Permianibacter fluminis TaxID=2738515 RepID=UPI001556A32D|nr:cupin domain-containing protein [Permianibacter fluminis]NQD37717.1 cupin domain-containing protein [Permianibacter fluminis]